MEHVNKNSDILYKGCLVEEFFREKRNVYDRYQFERLGFFVVDKETTQDHLVFNLIVPIKKSKDKKKLGSGNKKK